MSRAGKIAIAAGLVVIVLAVIGRLILGAYIPKPSAGGYLGVAEAGEIGSYNQINEFAASVGRAPDIVLYYSSWGERFQIGFADKAHTHGAVPFVQISPGHVSMSAIALGRYDAYLRSYADQVRAYGHRVVVGFAPEMNGSWDSWGWHHTSPATWKAAWRHVVTVFRGQGANNVIWLWTINISSKGTGPIQEWWPGANYVTWVGIDGYYYQSWETFANTFGATVAAVRKFTSRPILLSEVAIGKGAGQVAKIPDLFAGVRIEHLLGFVWFDETQRNGMYHQDWRLENNPAGLAVFRHQLRDYKAITTGLGN